MKCLFGSSVGLGLILAIVGCAPLVMAQGSAAQDSAAQPKVYEGSRFSDVWSKISATPYAKMNPPYGVDFQSLAQLPADAWRTLTTRDDLISRNHPKLIRPNGICLAGTWKITRPTPYSGYFNVRPDGAPTEGLVIARASVALDGTTRLDARSFGMAVKIFPTLDPNEKVETGNFFVIDDNGANSNRDFIETQMTNEPAASFTVYLWKRIRFFFKLKSIQHDADPNGHEGIRQLYPVSMLGTRDGDRVRTPTYVMIEAAPHARVRVNEQTLDFRDELKVENFDRGLKFFVKVSESKKSLKTEMPVGEMTFTQSVISSACDFNLHFAHPLFENR